MFTAQDWQPRCDRIGELRAHVREVLGGVDRLPHFSADLYTLMLKACTKVITACQEVDSGD